MSLNSPIHIALKTLNSLQELAAWPELLHELRKAWSESAPPSLIIRATEVFEDENNAIEWLTSPIPALGGRIPLEIATCPEGLEMVNAVLVRIEYGVYS